MQFLLLSLPLIRRSIQRRNRHRFLQHNQVHSQRFLPLLSRLHNRATFQLVNRLINRLINQPVSRVYSQQLSHRLSLQDSHQVCPLYSPLLNLRLDQRFNQALPRHFLPQRNQLANHLHNLRVNRPHNRRDNHRLNLRYSRLRNPHHNQQCSLPGFRLHNLLPSHLVNRHCSPLAPLLEYRVPNPLLIQRTNQQVNRRRGQVASHHHNLRRFRPHNPRHCRHHNPPRSQPQFRAPNHPTSRRPCPLANPVAALHHSQAHSPLENHPVNRQANHHCCGINM